MKEMQTNSTIHALATCFTVCGLLACDSMQIKPGSDFEVQIIFPEHLDIHQQVEPVEVRFTVEGCDDFDLLVRAGAADGMIERNIDFERYANGTYRTFLPISSLYISSGLCRFDQDNPAHGHFSLVAHCRRDARTLSSESRSVSYVPAWRSTWQSRGPVEHVLDGGEPGTAFTLGSGWLGWLNAAGKLRDVPMAHAADEKPKLLRNGDDIFVWVGCPLPHCGNTLVFESLETQIYTSTTYVYRLTLAEGSLKFHNNHRILAVPARVTDMAMNGDELVVLSSNKNSVFITRFDSSWNAQVEMFEQQTTVSQFGRHEHDTLTFVTADSESNAGYVHDVSAQNSVSIALPGDGNIAQLSLAPNGQFMLLIRDGKAYLASTSEGEWNKLDTDLALDDGHLSSIAWLIDGVALGDATAVEAFATGAPFAKRYQYDVWSPTAGMSPTKVVGLQGALDKLVVTTRDGVHVLDADGALLGGLAPMPCELEPTSRAAVLSGDIVGIAGREYLYQLDLGAL